VQNRHGKRKADLKIFEEVEAGQNVGRAEIFNGVDAVGAVRAIAAFGAVQEHQRAVLVGHHQPHRGHHVRAQLGRLHGKEILRPRGRHKQLDGKGSVRRGGPWLLSFRAGAGEYHQTGGYKSSRLLKSKKSMKQ
jgi:hypothetical protein